MKAKKFSDWFTHVKDLLKDDEKLTEQIKFKVQEIIEFCEAFSLSECRDIDFIELKKAKESTELKRLSMIQGQSSSSSQSMSSPTKKLDDEESKGQGSSN